MIAPARGRGRERERQEETERAGEGERESLTLSFHCAIAALIVSAIAALYSVLRDFIDSLCAIAALCLTTQCYRSTFLFCPPIDFLCAIAAFCLTQCYRSTFLFCPPFIVFVLSQHFLAFGQCYRSTSYPDPLCAIAALLYHHEHPCAITALLLLCAITALQTEDRIEDDVPTCFLQGPDRGFRGLDLRMWA